jgi:hypothetical protein
MARVTYQSKDDAGHTFWTARYGRYVIRIDANRPGVYRWLISLSSVTTSSYCPLPALRRSWPGGGSCRPG